MKISTTFKRTDEAIREALECARDDGSLDIVAEMAGTGGGKQELIEILDSDKEIDVYTRTALGAALDI